MVCIGGVIEGEGRERASLYGVQLFARSEAQSVDLAVLSAPERYRLLQFLTSWTRWYKLGLAEVDGDAARGVEGESPLCPDRKRSLEGYLRKQSFTTSQFFSATAADASLATPPMTIKSAGSLGSPLGSPTSQHSRSLKSGTFGAFGSPGSLGAAGGASGAAGGTGAFNTVGAFSMAGTGGSGSRRCARILRWADRHRRQDTGFPPSGAGCLRPYTGPAPWRDGSRPEIRGWSEDTRNGSA